MESPGTESADPVTPDASAVETPSTEGTQRRWNLRQRQRSSGEKGAANESAMDTTVTTTQTPDTEEPQTVPTKTAKGVKRSGPKIQATPAKRKVPAQKKAPSTPVGNAEAMFNAVTGGKSAVKNVASDWVDRYEENAESAMLELVQFLVRCCGCKARVTEEMFKSDTTEAIRALTKNFSESSYEYPLSMAGPQQKKFKSNFCDFIWRLVEQCQHTVLYDEYLLDTLIVWVVGFTDSQVRAFRHTSSLAGVKLVSALINIANSVTMEIDNTQRQVEAERKRQLTKKTEAGLATLEMLISKQSELKNHKTELEDTMKGLFSSIFVHRCRDVRPEIRALCITELGVWLKSYSVKFLADSYLKYIGWMLYDKVGEVRLACLKVLESLYGDSDTAPHMELFTERFKARLLSMRLDIDDHAAMSAISVLDYMQSLNLLDTEECQEVCELIFLEHRGVSHAAGQFAVNYLFSEDFMSKAKLRKVPKGHKKPTDGEIMLSELIKFFVEVKIHDHASYFVDSLWEHTEVLQDWESMSGLLLDEKCGVQLSTAEEAVLIEIIATAARRATGATPPAGRVIGKGKFLSSKDKKVMEEAKQELTTHFVKTLPDLMEKFGSSAQNAINLGNIPRHFELELYAESGLQTELESLLTHLNQLVMKHQEPEVLLECAVTFKSLLDPDFSLHSTSDQAFKLLIEEMTESFKQQLANCDEETLLDDNDDDCFTMIVTTRRLANFFKHIDIRRFEFCEEMSKLLKDGSRRGYSEKLLENAIVCMKHEVLWEMAELEQAGTTERESIRKLRSKTAQLFKSCEHLLKFANGPAQREAYVTLADGLFVFSKHLCETSPALSSLVYDPDPHLQDCLQDYVVHQILHAPEDEQDLEPSSEEEALQMAERLNDRRVQLAAFLKLAMFRVIDMMKIAPIWAEYIRQYPNFGDLIKVSMNRSRENTPILWYKTVFTCLKNCFLAYKDENGYVDQLSGEWSELKDLAKKFALSMGFEPAKVRMPLVGIHREGIQFSLSGFECDLTVDELKEVDPPTNIDFFMILNEFSHRLLAVDRTGKTGVISFLNEHLPEGLIKALQSKKIEGWDSLLYYYRNTATSQVGKGRPIGTGTVARAGVVSHSRARKRPLKINDSMSGDSSSLRPPKVSRIEGTPPSSVISDNSDDESPAPPPVRRSLRRHAAPES